MAEIVNSSDDFGNTMAMKIYNGHVFSSFTIGNVKDQLEKVKRMAMRPDDVFLLTYPRCGTHWVREIVSMLQRGEATYIDKDVLDIPPDVTQVEDFDKMVSPRTLFTHTYFQYLPQQFIDNNGKCVHVTRNPKDCAVSLYNVLKRLNDPSNLGHPYYSGPWDQFLKLFYRGHMQRGSFIDYHRQLEKAAETHPIYTVYYENIKKHPYNEIKKIGDFLELPYTNKLIEEITEKCCFKNLQTEKTAKRTKFFIDSTLDGTEIFYRKGEIGDWKNWFTVAQSEAFDEWFEEGMKGSKFKYQYT